QPPWHRGRSARLRPRTAVPPPPSQAAPRPARRRGRRGAPPTRGRPGRRGARRGRRDRRRLRRGEPYPAPGGGGRPAGRTARLGGAARARGRVRPPHRRRLRRARRRLRPPTGPVRRDRGRHDAGRRRADPPRGRDDRGAPRRTPRAGRRHLPVPRVDGQPLRPGGRLPGLPRRRRRRRRRHHPSGSTVTAPAPAPDAARRLLVVDDDTLVRAGLVSILTTDPTLAVVAEADDGHAALDAARRHPLDLVLLDIRMPRLDGLATLAHLRREHPALPVAMLTTFADEEYIAEAVGLGALGFLLKSDAPVELINAAKAVADGGAAFSPRVARWLVRAEATARLQRPRPG